MTELLEERQLLSASAGLIGRNGALRIQADSGGSDIEVRENSMAGTIDVFDVGTGDSLGSFAASSVSQIVFEGSENADKFENFTSISSRARGNGGADLLIGGSAADSLVGGEGNDTLIGNMGTDKLFGEGGNDLIHGDITRSSYTENAEVWRETTSYSSLWRLHIYGRGDDDLVYGGGGNDTLFGGGGDDTVYGNEGNDRLYGNYGNDNLYGGSGGDYLRGQSGHDGLFGGMGWDQMYGGSGNDRFLVRSQHNDFGPYRWRWNFDYRNDVGDGNDVTIRFYDGGNRTVDGQNLTAKAWTDQEIEIVDGAFRVLHEAMNGSPGLLRDAGGSELEFVRNGNGTAVGERAVNSPTAGWGNVITLLDTAFAQVNSTTTPFEPIQLNNTSRVRQTVYHEIGHNFDNENPYWNDFLALSDWQYYSFPIFNFNIQLVGWANFWTYDTAHENEFARDYGKTSPQEDFATVFAAYFMDYEGTAYYDNGTGGDITEKLALIDRFVTDFRG